MVKRFYLEWVSPRSKDRFSYYTVYYAHGDEIETVEMEVKNTTGNTNMVRHFLEEIEFIGRHRFKIYNKF